MAMGMGAFTRALVLCLCVLTGLPALARPASADSGLASSQEQVRHQLAAAATAVAQLDQQITALDRSIADTTRRVHRERQELRLIARTLYAEPDSALLALFGGSSLADALTRFSDLTAAGETAAAAERALDQDLSRLRKEEASLSADRQRAENVRQELDAQFQLLLNLARAAAAQPAAQPTATPRPSSAGPRPAGTPPPAASSPPVAAPPPAPPPVGPGGIQQVILNAFAPQGPPAQAWALRVARCESNFNPDAVNPSSAASGLFQFMPSTWANTPQGRAGKSVFDPTANAQAAAWYYNATGRTGRPWSCS